MTILNSDFESVQGSIVDYYRGGTDESTFGPHFNLKNSSLTNVGSGKRNKTDSSLYLQGVQVTNISNNTFDGVEPFLIKHTVGEPKTKIFKNTFKDTPAPVVVELNSGLEPTALITDNEGLNR